MLENIWKHTGSINVEQCDPDPFMDQLMLHGLPWKVIDYDHQL